MDESAEKDMIAAWRWVAAVLIYPITIIPGFHAVFLLISSLCVLLDSWSLEGAMHNLSLGLPAIAGITALWFSTLMHLPTIAHSRTRFVLVTTGLLMGLVLQCIILKSAFLGDLTRIPSVDLFQFWVFGGPLLVGAINLALLIRERNLMNDDPAPVPMPVRGRSIPRHHLPTGPALRPVILQPYRPPVSTRSFLDEANWN
jgi:hypothetical protein